jgi:hypothetical protein
MYSHVIWQPMMLISHISWTYKLNSYVDYVLLGDRMSALYLGMNVITSGDHLMRTCRMHWQSSSTPVGWKSLKIMADLMERMMVRRVVIGRMWMKNLTVNWLSPWKQLLSQMSIAQVKETVSHTWTLIWGRHLQLQVDLHENAIGTFDCDVFGHMTLIYNSSMTCCESIIGTPISYLHWFCLGAWCTSEMPSILKYSGVNLR